MWIRKANFLCDKSASVVGAKRWVSRLTGVAIESTGQIDSQVLSVCCVHLADCSVKGLARRARRASSEYCIHNPFRAGELARERTSTECARQINNWQAASLNERVVRRYVALQFVRRAKKYDLHRHTAKIKMPGDDKTVAGVV